ncbi:hypothetical protein BJ166DRAFT_161784 [Pestalotiopsis sp. NC0098]|nr:hypothetical protein BJ166DRAFT_161784 [Pestalotiopsis sp. NC0098]
MFLLYFVPACLLYSSFFHQATPISSDQCERSIVGFIVLTMSDFEKWMPPALYHESLTALLFAPSSKSTLKIFIYAGKTATPNTVPYSPTPTTSELLAWRVFAIDFYEWRLPIMYWIPRRRHCLFSPPPPFFFFLDKKRKETQQEICLTDPIGSGSDHQGRTHCCVYEIDVCISLQE